MLFDQPAIEAIVPGRHRRVRGEDGVLRHFAQRVVERLAVVVHPLADRFERGKDAMSFVQMIDARRNAERRQRLDATHAQHQLLSMRVR